MSHRRRENNKRREAAEDTLREVREKETVTPAMWAKASTSEAVRLQIIDAILEVVGEQLRIWMDDKRRRES